MISLYFHIPFCKRKCNYCDFYSISDEEGDKVREYIESLKKEIILRKTDEKVESIFWGGGTPSLLKENDFSEIADFIRANFDLLPDCEWTIEANPESFSEEKAQLWLNKGVNRLSLGVQSLNDDELKICGRLHDAQQATAVLKSKIIEKFSSVNVDLIYGLPLQTAASFESTLRTVCETPCLAHLSLYELSVGENTHFSWEREKYNFPSEEELAKMMDISRQILTANGFERYEVSNFAKEGKRCRHNENYWKDGQYMGFGAAAHSFDGRRRCANHSELSLYTDSLDYGELPVSFCEKMDSKRRRLEFLMLNLRTVDGFSVSAFRRKFKSDVLLQNEKYVQKLVKDGLMVVEDDVCKLTDKGLDMADGVAARL